MGKKINLIFEKVLEKSKPSSSELKEINKSLENFKKKFKERLKSRKIDAEIFIGGSFAKKTMVKKGTYDIDIFLRFDKKYDSNEISNLAYQSLRGIKKLSVIHGSRDYFRIQSGRKLFFEIVPVIKINLHQKEKAENITDLSYAHVNYIRKKIKAKKYFDEITLAKVFCHANNCYGAESYIKGFSGYSLELLVYYYKSFLKFIRAVSKLKAGEKLVIDIEKNFRNKQEILMNLNASKLSSPIILIDPTCKQRNALAALSEETFEAFRENCRKFLKNPTEKAFEIKKFDFEKIKTGALNKGFDFILLMAKTGKQGGDVAGSKLLKFYRHLKLEAEKFFRIKNSGFEYSGKKSSKFFLVAINKRKAIYVGPRLNDEVNVKKFKKRHKNIFSKSGRIYAEEKIKLNLNQFIKNWKKENLKKLKEMYLNELNVISI